MSSIPTKQIDGDVAVGCNVAVGGKATVRGSATIDHNLKVKGWLDAPNIKGVQKGMFKTEALLQEAYPSPETGWWVLVGDTLPAELYLSVDGVWEATGNEVGEIDLDLNSIVEEIEDLQDAKILLESADNDLEDAIQAVEQDLTDFKSSVGKANGIAPLNAERKVAARYMLPELYNVLEFNRVDDSEAYMLAESFETSSDDDFIERVVWLSVAGRFVAEYVPTGGGDVSVLSLDDSASGGVAVGKTFYKAWANSDRWCDDQGNPLAGKLYLCADNAIYAKDASGSSLRMLYADLLEAASRLLIREQWIQRCYGFGSVSDDCSEYTFLDLTLTHEEAMKALLLSGAPTQLSHGISPSCADEASPRVFLPIFADCSAGRTGIYRAFDGCSLTERVKLIDKGNTDTEEDLFRPCSIYAAFRGCVLLDKVELDLRFIARWQEVHAAFRSCESLQTLKLRNLRVSIDLSDCPLSYDSLKYLIDNSANENPITVTIASDIYATIMDESSGQWHALLSAAGARGIYFATI